MRSAATGPEGPTALEEQFGSYLLRRELASGGMATVYEAVRVGDDGFERRVAIKRIHPHLAKDPAFVEMFLDEARLVARIAHPNVCQVIDYGRQGGASFLAMEFLDGRSVSHVAAALARARPHAGEHARFVVTLILEAAEGLHAAHELRNEEGALLEVVHRDVSPQNLFVTFDGEVKVVDFGVASARDKTHQTETGEIKGKLAYMAPEQVHGQVDRRSDVWALGVVLWELLVLRRLFRRATQPETIVAVERDEIAPPSRKRPGVPQSLDEIVMAAVCREPSARIADARSLATRLSEALVPLGGTMSRLERADMMRQLFARDDAPTSESQERTRLPRTPQAVAYERDAQADATTASEVITLAESPPAKDADAMRAREFTKASSARGRRAGWTAAALVGLCALTAGGYAWSASERLPTGTGDISRTEFVVDAPEPSGHAAASRSSDRGLGVAPETSPEPALVAAPAPPMEATSRGTPTAPPRARRAAVIEEVARSTSASPPGPEQAAHAEPPLAAAPGDVFVGPGIAACFDAPCRDRSDATYGPRRLRTEAGTHTVHYIEFEGMPEGPVERQLATREILVRAGERVTLPQP